MVELGTSSLATEAYATTAVEEGGGGGSGDTMIPDSLLAALNAGTGTTCTRTEVDTSLTAKANQATVYTKTN